MVFQKFFFAQNEAQIVLSMMGERKRAFYCRINEFENPTKLNLDMLINNSRLNLRDNFYKSYGDIQIFFQSISYNPGIV